MAEVHEHEVDINEDNISLHGEVEEQAEGVMEEQAEGVMEEQAEGVMEEQAEDIMEEQAGAQERAGELEHAETFAVTPSATVLWDYAQEIVQDDMEYAHTHPHAPRPAHPPIQMSRRDKCLLALMVEDRREAVIRLWEELNAIEHLLGLEHI
ncbi:hypothetical protein C8R48DRAFT_776720 [Suillus tomentosus]|nr:hypothetical protein C8R48DRAFT_776720 [Suillus tomentosus]